MSDQVWVMSKMIEIINKCIVIVPLLPGWALNVFNKWFAMTHLVIVCVRVCVVIAAAVLVMVTKPHIEETFAYLY